MRTRQTLCLALIVVALSSCGRGRDAVDVGTDGGTFTLQDGAVRIVVRAGALANGARVTVARPATVPAVAGVTVIDGTVFDFGPDGLAFSSPAQITIAYDETRLPAGVPETKLGLYKLAGGSWQRVPGSSLDTNANTVTGPIGGFSTYGIVTFPGGLPVISGFGTATVNGVVDSAEWAFAARHGFSIAVPGGGTTPATLYAMNDSVNLYLAFTFQRNVVDPATKILFNFDNDRNQQTDHGDDRLSVDVTPTSASFTDGHWQIGLPCLPGLTCVAIDSSSGGIADGSGAFQNNGTTSTVEVAHPLDSTDNPHDFSLTAGQRIGMQFWVEIQDANQQLGTTLYPNLPGFFEILVQPAAVPTLAGTGTATINGTFGAGEWDAAACAFFPMNLPGGGTTPAQYCVMNDASNLYVAVRYARNVLDPENSLGVHLDQNNSGNVNHGDDLIVVQGNPAAGFRDEHWFTTTPCPANNMCSRQDTLAGGQANGSGAFVHTGGLVVYELAHPLSSGDSLDVSLAPGSTSGLSLVLALKNQAGQLVNTFFPSGGVAQILVK